MYTRCTDRFTKILANHSVPTYEYLFEYRGQYSIVNLQGEQVQISLEKDILRKEKVSFISTWFYTTNHYYSKIPTCNVRAKKPNTIFCY
jgi:hypothetical protein